MKVTICKFCDFACMLEGGKGAIIGMFDTIGSAQFPMTHPTFHVCLELEFDPDESGKVCAIDVALVDDDGHRLFGVHQDIPVAIPPVGRNVRILQDFAVENLIFPRAGTYRLDVICDSRTIAQERLYVLDGHAPGMSGP
jgi:hypothetical protein